MLANIDLRCVYNVSLGTKVYLGYKPGMNDTVKRTVKISSRRKKDIYIKDGSEVKVIIYNRRKNIYIVESINFNENGVGSVEDILINNNILYEQVSKERWEDWKKSMWVQSYIQPCDKGYYMWTHFWLDIDTWFVDMVSKDGVSISDGEIIKELHYKKVGGEISEEIYSFLDKMTNGIILTEEYYKLKDMCENVPALEIKFKEVRL